MGEVFFNAGDKGGNVTLSNTDKTATGSTAYASVRGTGLPKLTGKHYVEFRVDAANGAFGLALVDPQDVLTAQAGQAGEAVVVDQATGGMIFFGQDSADVSGLTLDSWYSAALDLDASPATLEIFDSAGAQVGTTFDLPISGMGWLFIATVDATGVVDMNADSGALNCTAPTGYALWDDGLDFKVQGTVTIDAVPAARLVRAFRSDTGAFLGEDQSDAGDGTYEILTDYEGAIHGIMMTLYGEPWEASTAVSVGDKTFPSTPNGRYYECTTAGTTGASEPVWPTAIDSTVADGSAVWTDRGTMEQPLCEGPFAPVDV